MKTSPVLFTLVPTLTLALCVYWYTKPPSILWIDSGTMIAAASSLGIPNPPGFPFYIMVGNLFTKLPFLSNLQSLQFLTIYSSVILLYFIYQTILTLAKNNFFFDITSNAKPLPTTNYQLPTLSAAFGTIALAFSYQFWSQSQNTEAFIFTYAFGAGFTFLLVRLFEKRKKLKEEQLDNKKYTKTVFYTFALIAFLFGLAAGANPTIAALTLPILFTMFLNRKYLNIQKLLVLGTIFALTLASVYSYLPLRASTWPFVNWGNPQTLELFIDHLHGAGLNIYEPKSNSVNGFTGSPLVFTQSIIYYIANTFIQFTPLLWPFLALGMYFLYKRNRTLLLFLLLVPTFNAIYSGIYYSGNQESWYILSWMFFAILIACGFYTMAEKIIAENKKPKHKLLALFALSFLPLLVFFYPLNRHNHYYSKDYIENLYSSLEPNAILIGAGDFFDALSHYSHVADKYRPDVVPVTANVFYVNKWNRDAIRHSTDLQISDDLESKIKYASLTEYNEVMNQFIDENIGKRPIYVTHLTLHASALAGTDAGQLKLDPNRFKFVPNGLSLRVVRNQQTLGPKPESFDFKMTTPITKIPIYFEKNYRGAFTNIQNDYVYAWEYLADWHADAQEDEKALNYYERALEIYPNAEVYAHLGEFYAKRGEYYASSQYLEKAERLDIKNPTIHFNLGLTYANLERIPEAIREFEAVKSLLADEKNPIFQDAQKTIKDLQTLNLNNPELAAQTERWKALENPKNNITVKIPPGFSASEPSPYNSIVISDNNPGALGLNIEILGRKLQKDDNPDEVLKKSPIQMLGQILDVQALKYIGYQGAVQIYGTTSGESQQKYVLLKDGWLWEFKVYPGNSQKLELFHKILSTFKPYEK